MSIIRPEDNERREAFGAVIEGAVTELTGRRDEIVNKILEDVRICHANSAPMSSTVTVAGGSSELLRLTRGHGLDRLQETIAGWMYEIDRSYETSLTAWSYNDTDYGPPVNPRLVIGVHLTEREGAEHIRAQQTQENAEIERQQAEYDAYYNRIIQVLGYENRVDYFMRSMGSPVAVQLMNKVEEGSLEMYEARWLLQQDQNGLHASRNADILPFDHIDRVVCRQGRIDLIDIFATDDTTANTIITDRETRGLLNSGEANHLRQRYAPSYFIEPVATMTSIEPLTYPAGTTEHFTSEQQDWTPESEDDGEINLDDNLHELGYTPEEDDIYNILVDVYNAVLDWENGRAERPNDHMLQRALYWDAHSVRIYRSPKLFRHTSDKKLEEILGMKPGEMIYDIHSLRLDVKLPTVPESQDS